MPLPLAEPGGRPAFTPPPVVVPNAVCREQRRLETPSVAAVLVDYHRERPVAGEWFSTDVHYFDMSLSPRPGSRGCFADVSQSPERLGRIFFAPAGFRLRAQGGLGRQRTLYAYVSAHPLFPDEEALYGEAEAVLRRCLRIDDERIGEALSRIAQEVASPGFAAELLVEGLGLSVLAQTARVLRAARDERASKGGLAAWRLRRIEERVRDGGGLPSLSELAALCGVSRRHLMRAFRAETGQTIGAYVQALTIERAKSLLCETDEPIGVVAAQAGFATAAAFTVAFRRATGQTPRSFRAAGRPRGRLLS